MSNERYHLGLIAYSSLLLKGLKNIKTPVQNLVDKSLLGKFNTNKPNKYIPVNVIYNFFEVASHHLKDGIMLEKCLKHYQFSNLGQIGKYVSSSTILLDFIHKLSKYDKYLSTNQHLSLSIKETETTITNEFTGEPRLGKTIMQELWLIMMLRAFQNYNGSDIHLLEINLPKDQNNLVQQIFSNYNEIIHVNQKHPSIKLKTESLPKRLSNIEINKISNANLHRPRSTMVSKIETIFESIYGNHLPTMVLMASFFNVSVSTLKRDLVNQDTCYQDIVDNWRFMKTIHLLTNTKHNINTISKQLYYSNAANFSRAFKRWSGLTPDEFRRNN